MTYSIENLKTIAKKEVPAGMRLCRVIAKKGVIGSKTMESQGCFVPAVSVNLLNQLLLQEVGKEFLCNAVAGVQDSLIRARIAAGHMAVYDNHIDVESLLSAMQEENAVARFSKESIAKWFNEVLFDPLHDAIKAKMGNVSDDMMRKLLNNYLEQFQVLAQRNPSMKAEVKAGLLRALDFVPEGHESVTAIEIVRRLNDVQEASVLLAAL
jgi:hypothetical protein